MNEINMILPIEPTPQRRVRFTSRGKFSKTYKDKEQIKNEDFLMVYLMPYVPDVPMTGAISLTVTAVFPVPASKSTWWQIGAVDGIIPHVKKSDTSNILKNLEDVMQTMGFFVNDSQINKVIFEKKYGYQGQWVIKIKETDFPRTKKEYDAIIMSY